MDNVAFAPTVHGRVSLARIDAVVSARLGPTRVPGNAQPACFNRQIAMYLARHVGRWSTTAIGRFYNGRDHSTVCHGIQRIEGLRESDPEIDALLTCLREQVVDSDDFEEAGHQRGAFRQSNSRTHIEQLAELIAERVCAYLEGRIQKTS
jgi:hypothetical protein